MTIYILQARSSVPLDLCWTLEEKPHVSTNICIILYVQPTLFIVYLGALGCSKGYPNFHHKNNQFLQS